MTRGPSAFSKTAALKVLGSVMLIVGMGDWALFLRFLEVFGGYSFV